MKKTLLVLAMIAASVVVAQPAAAAEADIVETTTKTDAGGTAEDTTVIDAAPPEPPPAQPQPESVPQEVVAQAPPPVAVEKAPEPPIDDSLVGTRAAAAPSAPQSGKSVAPARDVVVEAAAREVKVWVCKYVGTPGQDERLKSGKNPIFVSANTLGGNASDPQVGQAFPDAQGRSIVVQVGGTNPGVATCPPADADTEVSTEDPLLIPPTCAADGFVSVPTTPGVLYTITPSNTPGDVDVDAAAVTGYTLSAASTLHWDFVVESQLSGEVLCPVNTGDEPDSTDVKICHATAAFSNPYNQIPPATAGVARGHDTQHEGPIFDGVTSGWGDIIEPYVYLGVPYPGQNWSAEGQAVYANECERVDPPVSVVPDPPTIANACGQDGSVTRPVDTARITYAFTTGDGMSGAWEITATAQPGYFFADGVDATADGVVVVPGPCAVNQEVVPLVTITDACDEGELPSSVPMNGVSYAFTVGDGVSGPWTITATAAAGFIFGEGTPSVFSGDAGAGLDCAPPGDASPGDKDTAEPAVNLVDSRDGGALPAAGGASLWMLLLAGSMTAAGVLIASRRRPAAGKLSSIGGPARSLLMPVHPRHLALIATEVSPRGWPRRAMSTITRTSRRSRG